MKRKGRNLINKTWEYLKGVIKGSTKRLAFMYLVVVVLTPLVFMFTNKDNFELVLAELLGFLSLLAGIGRNETIQQDLEN